MTSTSPDDSYTSLRNEFRWRIPEIFNIAVACTQSAPPGATAIVDLGSGSPHEYRAVSYGQLAALSNRFAHALLATGLDRTDRVAVVLPQCVELLVAHLGTYRAGGVVVPLTVLFGVDALSYRFDAAGARLVVTDAEHLDLVRAAAPQARIVCVGAGGDDEFWEFVAAGSPSAPQVCTRADDPAIMIYTSGTTGSPKGALHGHRVLLGHLPGFELGLNDFCSIARPVSWTPADWAWIGGLYDLVMPTLYHGATLVASRRRGFDPHDAIRLIRDQQVTSTFLPPTALRMLARSIDIRPQGAALTGLITGGESLDSRTAEWGHDILGVRINEMYGQTEANFVAGNSRHWPVDPGHFGRPYPGHEVMVVDGQGHRLPPGTQGEIAVLADDPVVMLRYWNNPGATAGKIRDGLLYTGDIGVSAPDGALRFVSRADDVINSAGFRIGPAEIEDCLLRHPAVRDAAVIGVPDEVRGERVKAFLVTTSAAADRCALAEELTAHVRSRLGNYQYPREFEFIDEIPKTTTGKVRRTALRERHAQR